MATKVVVCVLFGSGYENFYSVLDTRVFRVLCQLTNLKQQIFPELFYCQTQSIPYLSENYFGGIQVHYLL